MDNASLLVVAMAEQCRRVIQEWDEYDSRLPKALQQKHLLWMCDKIEEHAEVGPANKLHRWIGFVQGAMLANRMLDLDELKAMFDEEAQENRAAGVNTGYRLILDPKADAYRVEEAPMCR